MRIVPLVFLLACEGGKISIDEGDDVDTDADTDVDTEDELPAGTLAGTLSPVADTETPAGNVTFVLVPAHEEEAENGEDEILILGAAWTSVTAGALADGPVDFEFPWPEIPADEFFHPTGNNDTEEGATFMLGAFVDADQSGDRNKGDALLGASFDYLIYLRGELSTEAASQGAQVDHWHIVHFLADDVIDYLVVLDEEVGHAEWDFAANLLPVTHGDLTFVVDDDFGAGAEVSLMSVAAFATVPPSSDIMFTTVEDLDTTGGGVTGAFPGPLPVPGDEHFELPPPQDPAAEEPPPGIELAIFPAMLWDDKNQNGRLDLFLEGSTLSGSSQAATEPRIAAYLRASDFQAAWLPEYAGISLGWIVADATEDGEGMPVPWEDGLHIATIPPP